MHNAEQSNDATSGRDVRMPTPAGASDPVRRSHPVKVCLTCGRLRSIAGRGLCGGCYGKAWHAEHPRPSHPDPDSGARIHTHNGLSDALNAGVVQADAPVPRMTGGTQRKPPPWIHHGVNPPTTTTSEAEPKQPAGWRWRQS